MENKLEIKVSLNTSQDVKDFCFAASAMPRNISVKALHGDYIVDGRSILGVFSLNLSEPITAVFESVNEIDKEKIMKVFDLWIVKDSVQKGISK